MPLPRNGVVAAATAIACGLGVTGLAEASATGDEMPVASARAGSAAEVATGRGTGAGSGAEAATGRGTGAGSGAEPSGGTEPAAMTGSSTNDDAIRVIAQPPTDGPVAGLSPVQIANARVIVEVGRSMGLPERAYVIAIACALQESSLRNLANDAVAESFAYPHDGRGADHDSVGVFQQRPSSGWGTVEQLMDPVYAARRFYRALARVGGWQEMTLTRAAQAVQHSAFPDAYARHEARAQRVVDAL